MKIKMTIALMLAALALLPSCSIKEDRSVCPCYVSVVTEAGSDCLVSFFDASGSLLERKVIPAAQLASGDNYTQVPRGPFHVSVLENMGSMLLDGGRRLECMEGRQAAPLYAFSVAAVAEGDAMTVEGTLQKQHAVVTVQLRNADGDTYPYDVNVDSGRNAMDLISLQGLEGYFHVSPEVDAQMKAVFMMSRQKAGEPINLYILDKRTGAVVATFDLNAYIAMTGYNWDAEWLADVTVTIDFSKSSLFISVSDWDEVFIFRFEI